MRSLTKFERCTRCGEYCWDDVCSCRRYLVAVEEWDVTTDFEKGKRVPGTEHLSFSTVWAGSTEDAARKFVERRDDEGDVLVDNVHVLVVGEPADPELKRSVLRYKVQAEMVAEYWAEPTVGEPGTWLASVATAEELETT